ncbi:MAG: hypothetical protein EU540_03655 [Promethearchaeota archaeon]|nr:MAG: hypothetical protein EU540_03655 [Candidatus Lokiarchaeota archaeon]
MKKISIDWVKCKKSPKKAQKVEGRILLEFRTKVNDLAKDLDKNKKELIITKEKLKATARSLKEINDKGMIIDYDVIVPTAQNQINIENDLKKYFNENLDKEKGELKLDAEKIIRAYDPCMSCATNFLTIDWIEE